MKHNKIKISSINEVYKFVDKLIVICKDNELCNIAESLNNALNLGSSGLEIIGAIKNILKTNKRKLQQILSPEDITTLKQVILFVNKCYGSFF